MYYSSTFANLPHSFSTKRRSEFTKDYYQYMINMLDVTTYSLPQNYYQHHGLFLLIQWGQPPSGQWFLTKFVGRMPSFPFGQKDEAHRLVSMAPEGSRNLGDLLGENHGKTMGKPWENQKMEVSMNGSCHKMDG